MPCIEARLVALEVALTAFSARRRTGTALADAPSVRIPTILTSLALLLLTVGCQPSTGGRLQSCGLLSPGEISDLPFYLPNGCYRDCYAAATCEELEETLCSAGITLPLRCDQECAFRCPDGTLLPVESECNGIEQCESGADELNCQPPGTVDGPSSCASDEFRCDGFTDCTDGSDERNCPFVCGNGERLSRGGRCDGFASCRDGSDEAGCATLTECSMM